MAAIDVLGLHCRARGLLVPVQEHRFHSSRKWRFDYAWPDLKVALEVEGGAWNGGRHTRGKGFVADMEKYNEATVLGWKILRCVPKDIQTGKVMELLERVIL